MVDTLLDKKMEYNKMKKNISINKLLYSFNEVIQVEVTFVIKHN
jgi:hypothetical protein